MSVDECLMWISHDSGRKLLSVPHTSFKFQENSGQRKSIRGQGGQGGQGGQEGICVFGRAK